MKHPDQPDHPDQTNRSSPSERSPSPKAPPRWIPPLVTPLLLLDRAADAALRLETMIRDELMTALVPPAARGAVTAWIYGRQSTYRAGPEGGRYGEGLFDWECRRLTRPPFPRTGHVLVGGAGGGREILGLLALGFRVTAFEPAEPLARSAMALDAVVAAGTPVLVGDYADLVRAVEHGEGPLASLSAPSDARFDAIVLGWGSLSHVLEERERAALLAALRRLAPTAPVLASWLAAPDEEAPDAPWLGRLRGGLRAILRRAHRDRTSPTDPTDPTTSDPAPDPGLRFLPWAGYVHLFARGEVQALAAAAGYRVAVEERLPYPHAVLVPAP